MASTGTFSKGGGGVVGGVEPPNGEYVRLPLPLPASHGQQQGTGGQGHSQAPLYVVMITKTTEGN